MDAPAPRFAPDTRRVKAVRRNLKGRVDAGAFEG
jgi:hypothetical protein